MWSFSKMGLFIWIKVIFSCLNIWRRAFFIWLGLGFRITDITTSIELLNYSLKLLIIRYLMVILDSNLLPKSLSYQSCWFEFRELSYNPNSLLCWKWWCFSRHCFEKMFVNFLNWFRRMFKWRIINFHNMIEFFIVIDY